MSLHPLTLLLWLLELATWPLYLAAAFRLLAALPEWRPANADARQLGHERAVELVGLQGRWALALQAVGFVLLLTLIGQVWPAVVPGAMCGTGVLQAMGPAGTQSVVFRAATLGLLYCWQAVERLDRGHPEETAVMLHGRLLLLAGPLLVMSGWSLHRALAAVAPHEPVSCCAAVYDRLLGDAPLLDATFASPTAWAVFGLFGAVALAVWGGALWRGALRQSLVGGFWPVALALIGLPVIYQATLRAISPYIFEVLWHPCPWCLLRLEHGAIGWAYFGLPAWAAVECAVGWLAGRAGRGHPGLGGAAADRIRLAGRRMVLMMAAWAALSIAPVLIWRWRGGGWLY
jgi:hypothetical protein